MRRTLSSGLLGLSLVFGIGGVRADVKPYALCTDGMVLQQQAEARLWGTADTGEVVTVTFRGKQAKATAGEGGRWVGTIPAGEAGGPFELTIAGRNTLTYTNVLVGEVWLCSGQSNMDWGLNSCNESDKAYANTAPSNAMLRLFSTFEHSDAGGTRYGPAGFWVDANPQSIYRFSAVGYFFGRHLQEQRKVPVGLIHAAVGATIIQAWLSPSAVAPFVTNPPDPPVGHNDPSRWYRALIAPLLDFRLRGAIWYQGEGNGGDWNYRFMLPALIEDWRSGFRNPDLAFHVVQLPPGHDWVWAREAQTLTVLQGRNTGLAVSSDCGGSIHPNPKRPVGERLALAARGITYGEKIVYSGPMLKNVTYDGARAVLVFNHVGGGLVAREMWLDPLGDTVDGKKGVAAWRVKEGSTGTVALAGFALRGADEKYCPAQAEIVGDSVVVSSPAVAAAAGVRYGFLDKDSPFCNLYNREGLPAAAFSTDGVAAPLTVFAGAGGTVLPSNALIVARGAPIEIRAMPARNHVFAGWTVLKGAAELANPTSADTTVRVTSSAALRANFALRLACALTAPASPMPVKAGSKVKLAATAAMLQGNGVIRKVEFFNGDAKIGEVASAPYTCTWSTVPAGCHTVTARATDSTGLAATSMPVCVVVTASGLWEGIHAEGGDVAYYLEGGTNWMAHTFTNSGKLRVTGDGEVEFLVVAGGGGGGGTYDGGGGGAGGLLAGRATLPKGEYTIQVGAGGTGEGRGVKSNGGDSFIARDGADVARAVGGGYGASSNPGTNTYAANGGSGGGGAHHRPGGVGAAGPPRQGYNGGHGGDCNSAGGGGAGGEGESSTSGSVAVRQGGPGRAFAFRDGVTSVTYASGGSARRRPGYEPLVADGDSKDPNTGDGGDGGSSRMGPIARGGNGGSGIVMVRYAIGK